jgi:Kdo2-lipid IVA lauroyltransferase/acyltransferase
MTEAKEGRLREKNISGLRRVGFILEAIVVIPLGALISFLPWKMGRILGRIAGTFLFHAAKRERKHAYHNLDVVFAENPIPEDEKERIVRNLFINMAWTAFEYLKIGEMTAENYQKFVTLENPRTSEQLDRVLEMKRGVIGITAHIGNWEYIASLGAKVGKNIAAIINRQLNPYTDRWLKNIRENRGKVKCHYNETPGLIQIIKHLKQNGILAILADEAASSGSVYAPFFGRETATTSGPARLHLRYRAPIMFYFCVRQGEGKYLLSSDGPYHFDRSDDFERDCMAVMTLINQKYEAVIKKYPDQWFSLVYPRWSNNASESARRQNIIIEQ